MSVVPGKILAQEKIKSSSSDNFYTVVLYDNCISCTCPAGGRKTLCKHMLKIIDNNLMLIKDANLEFLKELTLLLEMKNDKNHNLNDFKELSSKLIYSNKAIAEEAFYNAMPFAKMKNERKNLSEVIAKDIEDINIHHQFDFFELLCKGYNKKDIGFRFCEYPQNLDEFIKRRYLVETEKPPKLSDFVKIDTGRNSIYFYKFSPEVTECIRALHNILSVKFPKVQRYDEETFSAWEERIIDPKYL